MIPLHVRRTELPPPPGLAVTVPIAMCRLKQQVQQAVQQAPGGGGVFAAVGGGAAALPDAERQGAPQPPPPHRTDEQQYLRLPIESAKRLRWFDRQDLTMLMQARTLQQFGCTAVHRPCTAADAHRTTCSRLSTRGCL